MQCASWARALVQDEASLDALAAVVRKGQRGSTKARFAASKLLSAVTLGQLLAQGKMVVQDVRCSEHILLSCYSIELLFYLTIN